MTMSRQTLQQLGDSFPAYVRAYANLVRQLFTDTDVNVSIEGKRHLGAALGSRTVTEKYVTNKVQGWVQEITEVATTQPHAAYAAFTHGLSSRWSYISRTIPDICYCHWRLLSTNS